MPILLAECVLQPALEWKSADLKAVRKDEGTLVSFFLKSLVDANLNRIPFPSLLLAKHQCLSLVFIPASLQLHFHPHPTSLENSRS